MTLLCHQAWLAYFCLLFLFSLEPGYPEDGVLPAIFTAAPSASEITPAHLRMRTTAANKRVYK